MCVYMCVSFNVYILVCIEEEVKYHNVCVHSSFVSKLIALKVIHTYEQVECVLAL